MKRIILIEDDPSIQDAFRLIFKESEYVIISYDNGAEIMKDNFELPDLFILDKQLSGVDGLDICRYLKNHAVSRNVPVLIISASPSIVQQAYSAGADNVLVKPYRLAEVRSLVNRYLI